MRARAVPLAGRSPQGATGDADAYSAAMEGLRPPQRAAFRRPRRRRFLSWAVLLAVRLSPRFIQSRGGDVAALSHLRRPADITAIAGGCPASGRPRPPGDWTLQHE